MNFGQSPLTWLRSQEYFVDRQFNAGARLYDDSKWAQLSLSITMRWDPVRVDGGGGDGLTPSERQLAAKAYFEGAMAEAGAGLKDFLWRVACA